MHSDFTQSFEFLWVHMWTCPMQSTVIYGFSSDPFPFRMSKYNNHEFKQVDSILYKLSFSYNHWAFYTFQLYMGHWPDMFPIIQFIKHAPSIMLLSSDIPSDQFMLDQPFSSTTLFWQLNLSYWSDLVSFVQSSIPNVIQIVGLDFLGHIFLSTTYFIHVSFVHSSQSDGYISTVYPTIDFGRWSNSLG